MRNNLENSSAMQKSADTEVSADYVLRNHASFNLAQQDYRMKEQKEQRESHEKIDKREHFEADKKLKNALLLLNVSGNQKEIRETKNNNLELEDNLSSADKIKNYKEELTKQGKPQTEILSLLISKFEGNESVSVWVENWRNFQKLHQFAENKPLAERKAIQNIISKADFTSKTTFNTSLAEISQSAEISQETKLEISREFGGSHIDSVDDMDYQLKQVKAHKKAIEKEIDVKSSEKDEIHSEIESIETEIEELPLDSPKRQKLEEKLEQKKEILEETKNEIDRLEKGKPKDMSFQLRQGLYVKLNPDGSRSVKIDDNFSIKLPSHRLPFTTTRNLRAINLAFPYKILRDLHIADTIFSPNLENNTVPTKSQRDMGHLILSSLGIDDTKILSEENIKQLRKDLFFLKPKGSKTPKEHLIELGVFDVESQSLDRAKIKKILKFVRKEKS